MKWTHSERVAEMVRREREAEAIRAAIRRLQAIPELSFDDAAEWVLDEHHEAWQALADGAIAGRDGVPARRDLTSGG